MSDYYRTMVDRFLGWKLPPTFGPDAGIKFTPSNGMSREEAYAKPGWWPVGTNLLTATETRAMLEHILPPMPENSYSTEAEGDAYTHGWFDGNAEPPYGKPHIAEHLFIEQRGDGPWLVCVEKVFDTEDQARAACRKWQAATGGVKGRPWSVYQHSPGCFSVARPKGDDLEYASDKTLTESEARRRCDALNAGVKGPDHG